MKTMKIFSLVLLSILALAMASCQGEKVEYRSAAGHYDFVIKKVDGKRQWGLVSSQHKTREYIPCQYDSIFFAGNHFHRLHIFICVKDKKMYAWSETETRFLLNGKSFSSLIYEDEKLHNRNNIGGSSFYEALTDEGIMFFKHRSREVFPLVEEVGPAEAIFTGESCILCKRNGKWAVLCNEDYSMSCDPDSYDLDSGDYIYDAVICVGEAYFWVKKDGKWFAIDRDANVISKSLNLLRKYQKLPNADWHEAQRAEREIRFYKLSVPQAPEASYIYVPPTSSSYISW